MRTTDNIAPVAIAGGLWTNVLSSSVHSALASDDSELRDRRGAGREGPSGLAPGEEDGETSTLHRGLGQRRRSPHHVHSVRTINTMRSRAALPVS
jgi:hypothetical protein